MYFAKGDFKAAEIYLSEIAAIEDTKLRSAYWGLHLQISSLLENDSSLLDLLGNDAMSDSDNVEALAVCSKYQAKAGNWTLSRRIYQQALLAEQKRQETAVISNQLTYGFEIVDEINKDQKMALLEAELGLFLWEKTIPEYMALQKRNPNNLAVQFGLAKALIILKEWDVNLSELQAKGHRPAEELANTSVAALVQSLLDHLEGVIPNSDLRRWQLRSLLAYSAETIDSGDLPTKLKDLDDIEILAGFFRRSGDIKRSAAIVEKLGKYFSSFWQQALCYLGVDNEKGMQLAQKAIENASDCPFPHVVFARLAEAQDENWIAYSAIKEAVRIWPEEALWHHFAAELARNTTNLEDVICHLENAYAAEANIDWAIELARLYLQFSEKTMRSLASRSLYK